MNFIKKIIVICLLIGLHFHQTQGLGECPQTPPRSQASTLPNTNQTPGTIATNTNNYCKNILQAIAETGKIASQNDINTIANEFYRFFIKITYDMNNLGNSNEPFYMAQFYALCYAISLCADSQIDPLDIIYKNPYKPNIIAFALRNTMNHTYVLEFFVGRNEDTSRNNCRYEIQNHPEDNVTVIRISILLDRAGRVDLSKDENDFYNSPKIRCMDSTRATHTATIQPLQLDESYYTHNHRIRDILTNHINSPEDLSTFFDNLYQTFPRSLLSHLEKFYQAIFADVLIFTGMGEVRTEDHSHEGRMDISLKTHEGSTIIFEFKSSMHKKITAKTALAQIDDRQYPSNIDGYAHLVGIKITPIKRYGFIVDFEIDVSYAQHSSPRINRVPFATPPRGKHHAS